MFLLFFSTFQGSMLCRDVTATPDPKASVAIPPMCIVIQIGGVYTTFCQEEGIRLQKYRDRNGRCITRRFKSIGVRGQFDSPEFWPKNKTSRDGGFLQIPSAPKLLRNQFVFGF